MSTINDNFNEMEKLALERAIKNLTRKQPKKRQQQKKSGHAGIYWHSTRRKWVIQLKLGGEKRYIGAAKQLSDAVEIKNSARKEYFSQ